MTTAQTSAPASRGPGSVPAYWWAIGGEAMPAILADSGLAISTEAPPLPLAAPALCFVPTHAGNIATVSDVIRQAVGALAYLVAVPLDAIAPALAATAIDRGFDDILLPAGPDAPQCLARARRALKLRQAAAAARCEIAIERDYLQSCIDSLPTPIFFKNANGIYVGCNKAFEDYLGIAADKIIGASVHDISPPSIAAVYAAADAELLRTGGTQVYEAKARSADGGLRDVSYHKAVIVDRAGRVRGLAGTMLDITERKRLEERLIDAAERDPLTNCYNRRKFFSLAGEIEAQARQTGAPLAVAVIDVDHFKQINDRLGHAEGDRILCEIAGAMTQEIGAGNTFARAGGEEFFAIYPGSDAAAAHRQADRLRAALARRLTFSDTDVAVTVSIGVAALQHDGEILWDTLKRADAALYAAKNGGRNRVCCAP